MFCCRTNSIVCYSVYVESGGRKINRFMTAANGKKYSKFNIDSEQEKKHDSSSSNYHESWRDREKLEREKPTWRRHFRLYIAHNIQLDILQCFALKVARKELYIVTSVDRYFGVNRRNWSIECGLSLFVVQPYRALQLPFQCSNCVYDGCPYNEPCRLCSFHSIQVQTSIQNAKERNWRAEDSEKKKRKYEYKVSNYTGYVDRHMDTWLPYTIAVLNCSFYTLQEECAVDSALSVSVSLSLCVWLSFRCRRRGRGRRNSCSCC